MRIVWNIAGFAAFALGFLGAFLPLLPTVPLMLLAAYCFARGSDRFHAWLINHPRFGPAIRDWQAHGAISRKGKIAAGIAIAATFGISLLLGLRPLVLGIQAVVLAGVCLFIFTRPHGPDA